MTKVLKDTLEKVRLKQTIFEEDFHSDLLVFKEHDDSRVGNEVLALSLYGHTNSFLPFIRANRRIVVQYENSRWGITEKFIIGNTDNYSIQEEEAGEFKRFVFRRKVDQIIKREGETEDEEEKKIKFETFPLLFFKEDNIEEQKTRLYNMVKNGTTIPMFPNVEEKMILAGQLFIDKIEAEKVMKVLQGDTTLYVEPSILERAKFLTECYQNWKNYLFEKMRSKGLIKKAEIRYTPEEVDIYEVIIKEDTIRQIIRLGVKTRDLIFTKSFSYKTKIEDFNEYMEKFAPAMRERINSLAQPIHIKGDIHEETKSLLPLLKRKPFDAQLEAMEASLKAMFLKGKVNLIGECGVGKTFLMTATNWIYSKRKKQVMKLLVFCPDTLVETVWKEEIHNTLENVEVHEITSVSDLIKFQEKGYFEDKQDRAFILSQNVAKSGYTLKPAANWSKSQKSFLCPCCGEKVTETVKNPSELPTEPKYIEKPVHFTHFDTLRYNNYKCKKCEQVLWEPLNKEDEKVRGFVYINQGNLKGFYPRDERVVRRELAELVKLETSTSDTRKKAQYRKQIESHRYLEMTIQGKMDQARRISPRKVSVSQYIFKKMRYKFTNLIIDEFHEFQGESSRSDACAQLINSVAVVQTGTGTGMNGYASSRFNTDYMLHPEKMKAAGFNITDKEKYQATFGVTEKRWRLNTHEGKTKKSTLSPVPKPGISPVIFPLFMQDTTVFLSLEDLENDLPALRHSQIEVEMDEELLEAKEKMEVEIKKVARYDKKLFRGSIQIGYSYLDMPTIEKELKDQYTHEVLLKTPTISAHKDNKLNALLKLCKNEIELEDRRMLLYTYYTGDGINEYLRSHLAKEYNVTVLNRQDEESVSCDGSRIKVQKADREKFIRNEIKKGTNILIVNPELIKTGYNLIDFTTICYYQMGYQVYTNRQADKRTWRIGQKRDCKIIYIYYKDSIQQDIASLMATKIVASQAIEGNMDAAGLEAITSDRTAEEELAKKFFEGIRQKVTLKEYEKTS